MFRNHITKKILLSLFIAYSWTAAFAQEAGGAAEQSAQWTSENTLDMLLASIAVVLLLVISALAKTLTTSTKLYGEQKAKNGSSISDKLTAILVFVAVTLPAKSLFAQEALSINPVAASSTSSLHIYTWGLFSIILLELATALVLNRWVNVFITRRDSAAATQEVAATEGLLAKLAAWWTKTNNFVPVEEEGYLDTGHSYDGIRELDNVTPSWFTAGFALSILVACVYLWRYQISGSGPLMLEEYAQEMAIAKEERTEFLKNQANSIDENTVKMLGESDIAAGKAVFISQCAACHKDDGGGSVGPNLADEYWLHGGDIKDIFKSIKYGWTEKGMKSWKDDFSPAQIAQIASFVKSLKGSKPAAPKEAQGDLYQEPK